MKSSGLFDYCREIVIHHKEFGNAERLINLALSQGHVSTCLRSGIKVQLT